MKTHLIVDIKNTLLDFLVNFLSCVDESLRKTNNNITKKIEITASTGSYLHVIRCSEIVFQ